MKRRAPFVQPVAPAKVSPEPAPASDPGLFFIARGAGSGSRADGWLCITRRPAGDAANGNPGAVARRCCRRGRSGRQCCQQHELAGAGSRPQSSGPVGGGAGEQPRPSRGSLERAARTSPIARHRRQPQNPRWGIGLGAQRAPNSQGNETSTLTAGVQVAIWELDFFGRLSSLSEAARANAAGQ